MKHCGSGAGPRGLVERYQLRGCGGSGPAKSRRPGAHANTAAASGSGYFAASAFPRDGIDPEILPDAKSLTVREAAAWDRHYFRFVARLSATCRVVAPAAYQGRSGRQWRCTWPAHSPDCGACTRRKHSAEVDLLLGVSRTTGTARGERIAPVSLRQGSPVCPRHWGSGPDHRRHTVGACCWSFRPAALAYADLRPVADR